MDKSMICVSDMQNMAAAFTHLPRIQKPVLKTCAAALMWCADLLPNAMSQYETTFNLKSIQGNNALVLKHIASESTEKQLFVRSLEVIQKLFWIY